MIKKFCNDYALLTPEPSEEQNYNWWPTLLKAYSSRMGHGACNESSLTWWVAGNANRPDVKQHREINGLGKAS